MPSASHSSTWVEGPWPLIQTPSSTKDLVSGLSRTTNLCSHSDQTNHTAHYIANEMAFTHNAMLRGLNAIYLQAPHVPQSNIEDFLFFVFSWCTWVLHHHAIEDMEMFPSFEAVPGIVSGSLQSNVAQHDQFSDDLSHLQHYAVATAPDRYSGTRVQQLIEKFADALRQHLEDEIDTLWAMDSVEAGTGHSKNLLRIYQHCEAKAVKQDKTVILPMLLGLCDKTFEGGSQWPKMPIGSAYIVHYLYAWKHRGAWKFLPCDTFRNRRPLPFLGSAGSLVDKKSQQE